MLLHVVLYKFTDVPKVLDTPFIRAMMEAASNSETSVNFHHTTRSNNSEDSHLLTRRPKNLNSHIALRATRIPSVLGAAALNVG
jgi:hypothetical protein